MSGLTPKSPGSSALDQLAFSPRQTVETRIIAILDLMLLIKRKPPIFLYFTKRAPMGEVIVILYTTRS